MRRIAALCLGLLGAVPACAEETSGMVKPLACAALTSNLEAARTGGHLDQAIALYGKATDPGSGCTPKALFCLGRSVALAHVEAAYAAASKGTADEAARLFIAGGHFGEPWPLLVGLGDVASAEARTTHDPKRWADAGLAYQKAMIALDDPLLCPGEPPEPEAQADDLLRRKMALATLLANPVPFFHSKCAPCSLALLAHGPIAAAHPRALPITFEAGGGTMTPEGLLAAKALAGCAREAKWPRLALSAHTDERGSAASNHEVAMQRLETVRRVLKQNGYEGTIDGTALGKSEPLVIDDPQGLTVAEIQRTNRRIELRSIDGAPRLSCARTEEQTQ